MHNKTGTSEGLSFLAMLIFALMRIGANEDVKDWIWPPTHYPIAKLIGDGQPSHQTLKIADLHGIREIELLLAGCLEHFFSGNVLNKPMPV
jgi:hypothetical protein